MNWVCMKRLKYKSKRRGNNWECDTESSPCTHSCNYGDNKEDGMCVLGLANAEEKWQSPQ
jgi:hypothetical protein